MINRVVLVGRLTRDVGLNATKSGISVASFTIAINRKFKDEEQTDFINCVAWRGLAETLSKYTSKGQMVAVDGRLQARSYDREDGTKAYVTEVVADQIQFLGSKQSEDKQEEFNNDPFKGKSVSIEDIDLPF